MLHFLIVVGSVIVNGLARRGSQMSPEPQGLNCVSCVHQQYVGYPPQQYQLRPPQPPIHSAPIVFPVHVFPFPDSDLSSEEKKCGRCKYLRTSCKGAPRGFKCYEATIRNNIDHHGCKIAILSCDNSKVPVSLVTSNGDTLMEGVHAEKIVRCDGNGIWYDRDSENRKVNFRTVRCMVGQSPTRQGYLESHNFALADGRIFAKSQQP